jgi:hypothetical protein
LSVTQRRILTLLDTPGRLGDLPLGRSIDALRLRRDADRLTQAGLIVGVTSGDAGSPAAANAPVLAHPPGSPLARAVSLALIAIASVSLVWVGWRFAAAPAPVVDAHHAGSAGEPAASRVAPPVPAPEPGVIATRVLRGDPVDKNRDPTRDSRTSVAAKAVVVPAPGADVAQAALTEVAPARAPLAATNVGPASSVESTSKRSPAVGSDLARESASMRAPAAADGAASDPATVEHGSNHELRTDSGASASSQDP